MGDMSMKMVQNIWVNFQKMRNKAKEKKFIKMGNFMRVFLTKEKRYKGIIDFKMDLGIREK